MSVQDWGSIGELVAAIATVITLIYLAIQIRANTILSRADAIRESADKFTDLTVSIGTSPELRRAALTIEADDKRYAEMDDEERLLVNIYLRAIFGTANRDYEQLILGVSAEHYWHQVRDWLIFAMFPTKIVKDWWYSDVIPASSYNEGFRVWGSGEIEKIHGTIDSQK